MNFEALVIVSAKRLNAPVVSRSVRAIFALIFLEMAGTMTEAYFLNTP